MSGSVGHPFPFVDVSIAKANIYAEKGYDVLARGNSRRTTVTPGTSKHVALCFLNLYFTPQFKKQDTKLLSRVNKVISVVQLKNKFQCAVNFFTILALGSTNNKLVSPY